MPDVWTTRPDHLKNFLTHLGAPCGVEPRILKPRDPTWTCQVNGNGWIGDVYIHPMSQLWWSYAAIELYSIFLLLGLLVGMQTSKLQSIIHFNK